MIYVTSLLIDMMQLQGQGNEALTELRGGLAPDRPHLLSPRLWTPAFLRMLETSFLQLKRCQHASANRIHMTADLAAGRASSCIAPSSPLAEALPDIGCSSGGASSMHGITADWNLCV